jgi:AGZA family xanthine/uracil permease-like MFS transporter
MATLTKAESDAEHSDKEPRAGIDFGKLEFGLPAVLIMTIMPLTYSITNGIGFGFIAYVLIRVVQGKGREVNWLLWVSSIAFIIYFIWPYIDAKGWL